MMFLQGAYYISKMKFKYKKQYRLPDFDYSDDGEYFITICTQDHKQYFGKNKKR